MLTQAGNELICRTGPGTPMGDIYAGSGFPRSVRMSIQSRTARRWRTPFTCSNGWRRRGLTGRDVSVTPLLTLRLQPCWRF